MYPYLCIYRWQALICRGQRVFKPSMSVKIRCLYFLLHFVTFNNTIRIARIWFIPASLYHFTTFPGSLGKHSKYQRIATFYAALSLKVNIWLFEHLVWISIHFIFTLLDSISFQSSSCLYMVLVPLLHRMLLSICSR